MEVFTNNELGLSLRVVSDANGEVLFNLEDVARSLGFTTVAKSGNECVRWSRINKYLLEFGYTQKVGENTLIPEPIVYLLAMKANNEIAKKFQIWIAVDILPAVRKGTLITYQQRATSIGEGVKLMQELRRAAKDANIDPLIRFKADLKILKAFGMTIEEYENEILKLEQQKKPTHQQMRLELTVIKDIHELNNQI